MLVLGQCDLQRVKVCNLPARGFLGSPQTLTLCGVVYWKWMEGFLFIAMTRGECNWESEDQECSLAF